MKSPKKPPEKPKAIRCAIYTRKSTEEGLEQEFNTLDVQRYTGEKFIRKPWAVFYSALRDNVAATGANLEEIFDALSGQAVAL
jgi:site-specific DNA recombinase